MNPLKEEAAHDEVDDVGAEEQLTTRERFCRIDRQIQEARQLINDLNKQRQQLAKQCMLELDQERQNSCIIDPHVNLKPTIGGYGRLEVHVRQRFPPMTQTLLASLLLMTYHDDENYQDVNPEDLLMLAKVQADSIWQKRKSQSIRYLKRVDLEREAARKAAYRAKQQQRLAITQQQQQPTAAPVQDPPQRLSTWTTHVGPADPDDDDDDDDPQDQDEQPDEEFEFS